jgi:hypothetical protein
MNVQRQHLFRGVTNRRLRSIPNGTKAKSILSSGIKFAHAQSNLTALQSLE